MELSVLCGRRIDRYRSGCSGHVLPGGWLRIVDPTRGIVATYPSARLDDPHGAVNGRS
ncbi:MAG: hypothetical protein ABWY20_24580 [Mycobacterium sp.]